MKRRDFMKTTGAGMAVAAGGSAAGMRTDSQESTLLAKNMDSQKPANRNKTAKQREYNGPYSGDSLNRVAFPIGGIGAGMFCLEGTGAISHMSVRHHMDFFNEPPVFAAVCVKGKQNVARVLEGPVPGWKYFGGVNTGRGSKGRSYGFPRFAEASFTARFPFGAIDLADDDIPLNVKVTGWSPFIPGDPDSACLPVGAIEYHFSNPTRKTVDAIFSFNTQNFMSILPRSGTVLPIKNGFVLDQRGTKEEPHNEGSFAVFTDDKDTVVDHCWFRGSWRDSVTLVWRNIEEALLMDNPPMKGYSPGASLFVPFKLRAGQEKTLRLKFAWYVPKTGMRLGADPAKPTECGKNCGGEDCSDPGDYVPWYVGRFSDIKDVAKYWSGHYDELRKKSELFSKTFYDTTLPDEVVEAVAANLTILKSPTVLRQADGRLWGFEGCNDETGCCIGSCTHVWNYAQAVPHLFPSLERSLRETEYSISQDKRGHQTFRAPLPIRHPAHTRHAASDGQLGGIMKVYREWRISGDTAWLRKLWPKVKQSMSYCIETWDPRHHGLLEEPHHNTYDIEFWGPDGMCTSFYLGALTAAVEMGAALKDDTSLYKNLLREGAANLEKQLYNGEFFYQRIETDGLDAEFKPLNTAANGKGYKQVIDHVNEQGPKYQYGTGCISDGVLGFWIAHMCGLDGNIVDQKKIRSNLKAIHKYNLKRDLSDHANPQRPAYAIGSEGGLLLCTWPNGGELAIPFVYSDEVWTGIEYQVASHLMLEGMVDEGLEIVRVCRDRYDGERRNPFNEYECGHWYARALASYGLLQALTGVRYDAVDKTLHIDSQVGRNFRSFLSTEKGFGTVGLKNGKPFAQIKHGSIDIKKVIVSGKEMTI